MKTTSGVGRTPGTAAPTTRIAQRASAAWRPSRRLSTPEWIESHVRLPADFGLPGRFDLEDFPFWREPLDAMDDPDVFAVTFMTGTQIGKTETIKAILASQSALDPAPQMLVGPDKDYIAELRDKIYRSAEINPALVDRIPKARDRNLRWIDWGRCYCYLAWTGNTQRVSGKAVKLVVCSELDRFKESSREGSISKLIGERVKSFLRYKIIKESTPTDDASKIAAEYAQSDQRRYHVPCPHCGRYQELRFFPHREGPLAGRGGVGGLKDEAGSWRSPHDVMQSAYYVCEQGCRIASSEKSAMVAAGLWVPRGGSVHQTRRRSPTIRGDALRPSSHRGYQIGSIYARSISFGRIAAAYLEARDGGDKGMQNFFNNWLGLPFKVRAKVPKWRTLGKRLAGGHARGTVPAPALFLTAGVDVQRDRIYFVVRAWGEGSTSWLVDYGAIAQQAGPQGDVLPNSDLDQLSAQVLDRPWPIVSPNPAGQSSLMIRLMGIDCGFDPSRVWDYVRRSQRQRVRAVAGDPWERDPFFRMNVVEKNARTGKPYPGGMERWGINTETYKSDIQARWDYALHEPGAWFLSAEPLERAETYLRQITNEGRITKPHEKTGRLETTWQVIDPAVGNHYFDCEVYARAMADMVTGREWSGLIEEARRAAGGQRDGLRIIHAGDRRPDGRAWLD